MAPTPNTTLNPPIRVFIRIPSRLLDSYEPNADTKLIGMFSAQILNTNSSEIDTIRHLITKVARHAMIVLDYGVPADKCEPPVVAFDVKPDGSDVLFNEFHNSRIQRLVNDTVKVWADQNSRYGWQFPSRTDLRKNQQTHLLK